MRMDGDVIDALLKSFDSGKKKKNDIDDKMYYFYYQILVIIQVINICCRP